MGSHHNTLSTPAKDTVKETLEEAHRDLRRAKWKLRAAEAELAATPANETVKEVVEGRRRTVKMCEAIIGLIKAETGLGQPPEGLHKECQQRKHLSRRIARNSGSSRGNHARQEFETHKP